MPMSRFRGYVPDLVAFVAAWVLGGLLDWWNWPRVGLEGGIFIVLVMIWARLASRGL